MNRYSFANPPAPPPRQAPPPPAPKPAPPPAPPEGPELPELHGYLILSRRANEVTMIIVDGVVVARVAIGGRRAANGGKHRLMLKGRDAGVRFVRENAKDQEGPQE